MTPEQVRYSADGFAVIARKAMMANLPQADLSHLPQGSNRGRGDIISGEDL